VYEKAYQELNTAQKIAVDTIDGPVMVVAGPGTGKTQLLAARIGRILSSTDTQANNILCLTFTDAGALAMRQRLISFIGPIAYNVNIYTYHGFCNMVIQDNIEYFGGYLDLQKASDLELLDIYIELIDGFKKDHPLKRLKGDIYYDKGRLSKLFGTMKQENWTQHTFTKAVKEYEKELYEDENYKYKRNYKEFKKGDVKQKDIDKELGKLDSILAGVKEFNNYNKILENRRRYDYADMILWVLKQFKENENLLLKYQEKFQYILVDEYQDTNGSQNELVYTLSSFWEEPNLFVVGDDDQSIYRFQGANMDNIVEFKTKFDPATIVLENNYRSGQLILDKSTVLINNNIERLASIDKNLTKKLIESGSKKIGTEVTFTEYHNNVHEEKAIINDILKLKDQGFPLKEIAIIYRKHSNVENIVKYLEMKQVPINVKKKINVLDIPCIRQIISMLKYIYFEKQRPYSADHLLFEILHFSYFELSPKEIGKISISIYNDKYKTKWRDIISNEIELGFCGVKEPKKITEVAQLIEGWITDIGNVTVQVLLEKIMTQSTLLDDLLGSTDASFMLQVVSTFFDFVKNECTLKPTLNLGELIDRIEKIEMNKLEIPFHKIVHSEDGVNFITAHSAKGLEFEKVYIIRGEQKNWEDLKFNTGKFKFPPTLIPASDVSDVEDDRRLFFVAMTRAAKHLNISYCKENEEGKEMAPTRFIHEILDENDTINKVALSDDDIIRYKADLMRFKQGEIKLIDHDLIDLVLQDFTMSVTNLNKYLECPVSFYYEVILRVPQARNSHAGFGSAIHETLHKLFQYIDNSPEKMIPSLDVIKGYYKDAMNHYRQHFTEREYHDLTVYGHEVLEKYYEANKAHWSLPRNYKLEEPIKNVHVEGIPIKGLIDKIVYHDDHFYVVDYKTGKYAKAKLDPAMDEEIGSNYWRQIVFYHLLIEADPNFNKSMKYGKVDFVEPDKYGNYKFQDITVSEYDQKIVIDQLTSSYEKIQNHEFSEGCKEEHCRWCNFIADHLKVD